MQPVRTLLAVAILVVLGGAGAWCCQAEAGVPVEESKVAVTGTYRNAKYAYSVQVPVGLRGHRMKAPAPNHAVEVRAPGNETDVLLVDGSFDSAGFGSAETYAQHTAKYYEDEYGLRQLAISRSALCGLDARKVVLGPRGSAAPRSIRYVTFLVALRSTGNDNTPVIYTISVLASTRDSAVLKAFPAVVESFRTLPWK